MGDVVSRQMRSYKEHARNMDSSNTEENIDYEMSTQNRA